MTDSLPTNALAVDTYLRSLIDAATLERLKLTDGVYPFLFGMATVKLGEANAEVARLRALLAEMSKGLDDVSELLESIR